MGDSRGFIHPPLMFQVGKVMVWFRVNQSGRRPVMVKMCEDQNVFEALEAATTKTNLDLRIALEWVTVMFNGKVACTAWCPSK